MSFANDTQLVAVEWRFAQQIRLDFDNVRQVQFQIVKGPTCPLDVSASLWYILPIVHIYYEWVK